MVQVVVHINHGCLFCERDIGFKEAIKGKKLCSVKCMKEINKLGCSYNMSDVARKGNRNDYRRVR